MRIIHSIFVELILKGKVSPLLKLKIGLCKYLNNDSKTLIRFIQSNVNLVPKKVVHIIKLTNFYE